MKGVRSSRRTPQYPYADCDNAICLTRPIELISMIYFTWTDQVRADLFKDHKVALAKN